MNEIVNEEEPETTTEESKSIKAIVKDTIHQICSGQVVLSLAVAVKELVENSVDAGATLVEIKLHNQGLDSVEVSDNGYGVSDENIQAMTAKYHTSKLREFVDLQEVETFGFRGEALSSLCALSDMTIITRTASSDVGIRVELDHEGNIKKKTHCARQVGTTVTLCNLFSTLPVRKREFTKNIKKEFSKMCQILQGYCLVSKGVRIICSNVNQKGSKSVILSTHGSQNYLDNIQTVFGHKQAADVVKIKSPFEEKLSLESFNDLDDTDSSFQISEEDIDRLNAGQFSIEGWISSCAHGKGRGSKDRQFFFVNSRPCEPKNVIKAVNQIYHRYNLHQHPFVFLNVTTERSQVDINLTPDKRQLLINNEKILLLAVKKALLNTFGNIPSTFKVQNTTLDSLFGRQSLGNEKSAESDDEVKVPGNPSKFMAVLSQWKATGDTLGPAKCSKPNKRKPIDEISVRTAKLAKIQQFLANACNNTPLQKDKDLSVASYKSESDSDKECDVSVLDTNKLKTESKEFDALLHTNSITQPEELVERIDCNTIAAPKVSIYESKPIAEETDKEIMQKKGFVLKSRDERSDEKIVQKREIVLDSSDDECNTSTTHNIVKVSIEDIRAAVQEEDRLETEYLQKKLNRLKFKSRIDPNQNKSAEEELALEISKDMFAKMEIIGQFNLGFIIVRLDSDLLIVDQHATDEKYNFEQLQTSTVLQYQPLTVPQRLEMTADSEMILTDHLDVFEKNGFKLVINENEPPTKRIKLLGKPFSKNWEFGKDDIDELIFMLRDAPKGSICRPSRIRSMFASRACRKSVMIGTALSRTTMRSLIDHMGEIDQPWNCPHGRPTMRHLVNIDMLLDEDGDEDDEEDAEHDQNSSSCSEKGFD